MAEVYGINMKDWSSEEIDKKLLNAVSKKRREKIGRYYFTEDVKRSLYASVLVRYIACMKLALTNDRIHIEENCYGKPYLYGISNTYFNISHSGEWVICAWSSREIGVDIEEVKECNLDIAKNYFCPSEFLYLLKQQESDKKGTFYDYWTLKESYIKFRGKGLSIPLNSFELDLNSEEVRLYSCEEGKPKFFRLQIDDRYKSAICTLDEEVKGLYEIPSEKVLNMLMK